MAMSMAVVKTPITMADFARALIRTMRAMNIEPTKAACGVFWSQYALETGAGGFCFNFNLFNHKVTAAMTNAGVPFMMLANTWEMVDGIKRVFQPPSPVTWFRAYASFEAAMSDHINSVRSGRYASSWPAVVAGDLDAYAIELHNHGYFTASVKSYEDLLAVKDVGWMQSTAFEDALAEIKAAMEDDTLKEASFPVVHPDVDLDD